MKDTGNPSKMTEHIEDESYGCSTYPPKPQKEGFNKALLRETND